MLWTINSSKSAGVSRKNPSPDSIQDEKTECWSIMQNQEFTRAWRSYSPALTRVEIAFFGSGDDLFDRLAEVDFQPFLAGHFEPARIEPELVQHSCMDVGDIVPVFYGMEA